MATLPDTMIPLDTAAGALKVHPRTVLRAIKDKVNTYWAEGYSVDIPLRDLSEAYDFRPVAFERVLRGKDELFKQTEAAEFLDVHIRVFKYRKYPAFARRGGVVRYLRSELAAHHVTNYV